MAGVRTVSTVTRANGASSPTKERTFIYMQTGAPTFVSSTLYPSTDVIPSRLSSPVKSLHGLNPTTTTTMLSNDTDSGGTLTIMRYSLNGQMGGGVKAYPAARITELPYEPYEEAHTSYQPVNDEKYNLSNSDQYNTGKPAAPTTIGNGYDHNDHMDYATSKPSYGWTNGLSPTRNASEPRSAHYGSDDTPEYRSYSYNYSPPDYSKKHAPSSNGNGIKPSMGLPQPKVSQSTPYYRDSSSRHNTAPTGPNNNYNGNQTMTEPSSRASSDDLYGTGGSSKKRGKDLGCVLDESEFRRQLLVEKLEDAKKTIQMQAQRLAKLENKDLENTSKLENLKYKEDDYKRKLQQANEKQERLEKTHSDDLETLVHLEEKISGLESDLKTMAATNSQLQAKTKKRHEALEQTKGDLRKCETDNQRLEAIKSQLTLELASTRDALEAARNKAQSLELRLQSAAAAAAELDLMTSYYKKSSAECKDLKDRLKEESGENKELRDRIAKLMQDIDNLTQEKDRLLSQVRKLQEAECELHTALTSETADKDRHFREKLDLHQQLNDAMLETENLRQDKEAVDQQLAEMRHQVETVKQKADEEHNKNLVANKELDALNQSRDELTLELSHAKAKVDQLLETNGSLEQARKLALQRHEMFEQEIRGLQDQVDNTRQAMQAMTKSQEQAKVATDEHISKLKEEIQELKADKAALEEKLQDTEAKLRAAEQGLKECSEMQMMEAETWKANVDRLAASLARKDAQMHEVGIKLEQLKADHERGNNFVKTVKDSQQHLHDEIEELKEENHRLKDENKRLLQERAENEQLIQLLEIQKQILSKMAAANPKEETESTETEVNQLRNQVQQLQKEKDQLLQERDSKSDLIDAQTTRSSPFFRPLVEGHGQGYGSGREEPRRKREDSISSTSSESAAMRRERAAMEEQVRMMRGQAEVMEANRRRADDTVHRLERKVEDLQEELFRTSQSKVSQMAGMQQTINDLHNQLEHRRPASVASSTDGLNSNDRYEETAQLRKNEEIAQTKRRELSTPTSIPHEAASSQPVNQKVKVEVGRQRADTASSSARDADDSWDDSDAKMATDYVAPPRSAFLVTSDPNKFRRSSTPAMSGPTTATTTTTTTAI